MQIKEVCENTGLTTRTVRFYIEEGLISPTQKRQFNGRRNIDFNENDCNELKEITLLRQAYFSLSEIKALRKDKSKTFEYAVRCKRCLEKEIKENTARLDALGKIDETLTYDEFVKRLQGAEVEKSADKKNIKSNLPKLFYFICLALSFAAFCYLNLLFIKQTLPASEFSVFTVIGSIVLFLSIPSCVLSFLKPRLGFVYILYELMLISLAAYFESTKTLVFYMLLAVIVNAVFYILFMYKTNAIMEKK